MGHGLLLVGLGIILVLALVLPFLVRQVEEELEIFFLTLGVLSVTLGGLWSRHLVGEAALEPLKISCAVLVFGSGFRWCRSLVHGWVANLARAMGIRWFAFSVVVGVGLLSSVITAIISALLLIEVVSGLGLRGRERLETAVIGCFAIGLGAALTPVGEPLSTIATLKLSGPPHHAGFFFLARMLAPWLVPGILAMGALAASRVRRSVMAQPPGASEGVETWRSILGRAGKVHLFVASLILLGRGFSPLVDRYVVPMPKAALYWINMVSAILDNATLAAAEVSPLMDAERVRFLLLGLLIAGGMLVPGNVPNILCAKHLDINNRDWARIGVPLGLALMSVYFGLEYAIR